MLVNRSIPGPPAPDPTPGGTEHQQDQPDDQQDDADRHQDAEVEHQSQDQQDQTENYHGSVIPQHYQTVPSDMIGDSYTMANRNRCTVHPQHLMVNRGRIPALFGDLYLCDCGEERLGNTDEARVRRGTDRSPLGRLRYELRGVLRR